MIIIIIMYRSLILWEQSQRTRHGSLSLPQDPCVGSDSHLNLYLDEINRLSNWCLVPTTSTSCARGMISAVETFQEQGCNLCKQCVCCVIILKHHYNLGLWEQTLVLTVSWWEVSSNLAPKSSSCVFGLQRLHKHQWSGCRFTL